MARLDHVAPRGRPSGRIRHGAQARAALLRGARRIAALVQPTLGPLARTVAVASVVRGAPPEILDSGAFVARRVIELADPFENTGAMLVRHVAWRVYEQVGDGVATAVALAVALLEQSFRYVETGGDVVALRRGVARGLVAAQAELRRQARPVDEPSLVAALAERSLGDPALAALVGEVLDTVGLDGAVDLVDGCALGVEREYVDGLTWGEGYHSAYLLRNGESAVRLLEPRVLVTDRPIERVGQLAPALEACLATGSRSLLVVAPRLSDAALALLIVNRDRGVLDGALAVRAPLHGAQRTHALDDLAVATGGRCIRQGLGEQLEAVALPDLGRARQAWATSTAFCIVGGHGSRQAIRERLAALRAERRALAADDYTRQSLAERIARLSGAAALVRVGAATDVARADLKARLEAALNTGRAALRGGVVPGGAAALAACAPAVEHLPLAGDEAVGARLLARALFAPLRALAHNAGLDGAAIARELPNRAPGWAFDVVDHQWVDARAAGLVDALPVALTALEVGASAALTALATEALVRPRRPQWATAP